MPAWLARGIATLAGIGQLPVAPGTWASAATLLLWMLIPLGRGAWLGLTLAILLLGTWAAQRAESIFGHDDHRVVIDEVAGALIAVAGFDPALRVAVAGFLLFRIFDIVKPPPIYQIQALPGGIGVMADDVLAGVASNLLLRVGASLFPGALEGGG